MKNLNLLKVLYENEKIVLSALSGDRTIYGSKEIFLSHVAEDFEKWGLNRKSKSTPEIEIEVYEMVSDADFNEIFTSLSTNLDTLCLTQNQIIDFCVKYPGYLRQDGYGTFFLFKKRRFFRRAKFFVAHVDVDSDGLFVNVYPFDNADVWSADCRLRLVVPKAE